MEHWISWFHEQTHGDEVSLVARTAESLGFTGVAFSDHVAIPRNHTVLHPQTGQPYDYRLPKPDDVEIGDDADENASEEPAGEEESAS